MSSPALTVVAKIKAKPGKEDAVRAELRKLVNPTHAERGCLQYDLHESNTEPGLFLFYENWTNAEDLKRHSESAHLAAFKKLGDELLAMPTEITLWTRI